MRIESIFKIIDNRRRDFKLSALRATNSEDRWYYKGAEECLSALLLDLAVEVGYEAQNPDT